MCEDLDVLIYPMDCRVEYNIDLVCKHFEFRWKCWNFFSKEYVFVEHLYAQDLCSLGTWEYNNDPVSFLGEFGQNSWEVSYSISHAYSYY